MTDEITINRVDYFQNYAGRFLSVEAFNATTVQQTGGGQTAGQGPTLAVTWDAGPGTEIGSGGPRNMSPYVDPDPAQDTYLYHRMLIRLGAPEHDDTPPRPSRIRIASSTGAIAEADVNTWIGQACRRTRPASCAASTTATWIRPRSTSGSSELAAEFGGPGGIAELINLPNKTNGYQRKAQVTMDPPGARMSSTRSAPAAGTYTVAQATYGPSDPVAGIAGATRSYQATAAAERGLRPITGFPAGSIALVDRGNCNFADKTLNAQPAGAIAVVVVNNVPGAPTAPGGTASRASTIPTVMVGQADGACSRRTCPRAAQSSARRRSATRAASS